MTSRSPSDLFAELPILEEVGAEIARIFDADTQSEQPAGPSKRRWSLRPSNLRLGVLVAVLVFAAAAGAVAASGILSGAPVPGFKLRSTVDYGVPVSSSVRLLNVSVADPTGGPPWGLRAVRTTRGLGCLQYGRLVDGRLGVLGQDSTFHDDGRFHPLPPNFFQPTGCSVLDANGRSYFAAQVDGVPASGYDACTPVGSGRAPHAPAYCPAKDARALYYGALGPDARSITYIVEGVVRTVATVGMDGTYLIVTRATPGANPNLAGPGVPDGTRLLPFGSSQPIIKITYKDGYVCHLSATGNRDNRGRPCRPPGFRSSRVLPTAAEVRSPVTVRLRLNARLPGLGRISFAEVTFIAHVPIHSAGNTYAWQVIDPRSAHCGAGSGGGETDTNITAGQHVTIHVQITGGSTGRTLCPGVYKGRIAYLSQTSDFPHMHGPTVAYFTIRVP